jgi:hypothetical protein
LPSQTRADGVDDDAAFHVAAADPGRITKVRCAALIQVDRDGSARAVATSSPTKSL